MIERATGILAAATAVLGLWMALRHVAGARPGRAAVAAHLLAGAALLDLVLLAARPVSGWTAGMVAAALVSGMMLPLTAKRLPESSGPIMLGHGMVALTAVALVAIWATG